MLRTLRPAAISPTGLKAFAAALFCLALFPAGASAQVAPVPGAAYTADEAVAVADASETMEAVGIGLAVLGGGIGIGLCGFAATGAMARQPEIAGQIQTAMLIPAVLIEGATIIALAFCLAA